MGCDAVKTGMLANATIVEAVAAAVESLELPNLVVDPVMIAKSGDHLLDDEAVHALRWTLLRLARVVTPNIPEAEVLAKMPIASLADMREAATRIATLKPRGGRDQGRAPARPGDRRPAVGATASFTNSSARASRAATRTARAARSPPPSPRTWPRASTLKEAVQAAKSYVEGAMQPGIPLGKGHRPLNHFWRGLY